ncbi:MAG: hypothetical protein QMB94_10175 [Phycisphaerales bacterium]
MSTKTDVFAIRPFRELANYLRVTSEMKAILALSTTGTAIWPKITLFCSLAP